MIKIKQFFKKYGIWLLIGVFLGCIIILIILLNRDKEDDISLELPVERIASPYIETEERILISTTNIQEQNFQEREWVYRVNRPNSNLLVNFIEKFYEVKEDINIHEEVIITDEEDMYWYHANIGVLSVFSEGLNLDLKITNARDVSSFFSQYFGIKESVNEKVQVTDNGTLYSGHFQYHDLKIGSSHLGGYGYKLELNKQGKLIEFSMLLLKEENLEKYQLMPTTPLSDLLNISNYPKKIKHTAIEDRFYNQPELLRSSVNLRTLTVKGKELLYLLNDFDDQFILPNYKISGDGELEDSRGGKYWTSSDIFICAIDPEYLYEKPVEDFREQPHSDPSY